MLYNCARKDIHKYNMFDGKVLHITDVINICNYVAKWQKNTFRMENHALSHDE